MKRLARLVFFLAGGLLAVAPMLVLLWFSYSVGEPPTTDPKATAYFVMPVVAGLVLGGGLFLAGLPNVVVGSKRPVVRIVAAMLMTASTAVLFWVGFDGLFTAVACPLAILLNATAFVVFVYPAKSFSGKSVDSKSE